VRARAGEEHIRRIEALWPCDWTRGCPHCKKDIREAAVLKGVALPTAGDHAALGTLAPCGRWLAAMHDVIVAARAEAPAQARREDMDRADAELLSMTGAWLHSQARFEAKE